MNDFATGFLYGLLTLWVVLGTYGLFGLTLDWKGYDTFWLVLCFPVLAVVAPAMFVWYGLIYGPWRHVIHPVRKKYWERMDWGTDGSVAVRLFGNFYFCHDPAARRWYNRIFFARVRRE